MQNIINDDNNADFEDFYEYEGQYTEYQDIEPRSDLFNFFMSYKQDIEMQLG